MWSFLASFLGGPVINGLIGAYKAKLEAGNTEDRIAADLAGRELDVQRRELEVEGEYKRAVIGRWYEPTNLFGYVMVAYFGKLIVWDKVIGSFMGQTRNIFETDAITGEALTWAGMIMLFFVGKRAFENVARIMKR